MTYLGPPLFSSVFGGIAAVSQALHLAAAPPMVLLQRHVLLVVQDLELLLRLRMRLVQLQAAGMELALEMYPSKFVY